MQGHAFLLLVLLGFSCNGANASCKFWCKAPGSTGPYECCDSGNPYFKPDQISSTSERVTSIYDVTPTSPPHNQDGVDNQTTTFLPGNSSGCFYYCSYASVVYCCHDDSVPVPIDHNNHTGRCPRREEQTCKASIPPLGKLKTTNNEVTTSKPSSSNVPAKPLVTVISGTSKTEAGLKVTTCASDGYCPQTHKCCPNSCLKRHTCLPALPSKRNVSNITSTPADTMNDPNTSTVSSTVSPVSSTVSPVVSSVSSHVSPVSSSVSPVVSTVIAVSTVSSDTLK